jgi:hypothetical protein
MTKQSGFVKPTKSTVKTPKIEIPKVQVDYKKVPIQFLEKKARHRRQKPFPRVSEQDATAVLKRIKKIKDRI